MDDALKTTAQGQRWTAVFYASLLFILVLDLILLFWILDPLARTASVPPVRSAAVVKVDYRPKPSPFDGAANKPHAIVPNGRRATQVRAAMPAYVSLRD